MTYFEDLKAKTYFEDLDDFVGNTLKHTSKPFGVTHVKEKPAEYDEVDYQIAKKSLQGRLAGYARNAKPVEVWTERQKELLADIDALLARPIPVYDDEQ